MLTFSKNEALLDKLSKQFMAELYHSGRLITDPLSRHYLQTLTHPLIIQLGETHQRYRFFVLQANDINALAAPGGTIIVNSGLILRVANQHELAAVLAHEIIHVKQQHLLQRLDYANAQKIPMIANGLAAIALGLINPALGSTMLIAGSAGIAQSGINYTRHHEAEADELGIELLYHAGYNPESMIAIFQRLQEQSRLYGTDIPSLLRSHPLNRSRIAEAENRVQRLAQKIYVADDDFVYFQARLRIYGSMEPLDLLGYYQRQLAKHKTPVLEYGYALAQIQSMHYHQAQVILRRLHKQQPNNLFISLGLVDSYMAARDDKPAQQLIASLRKQHDNDLLRRYAANVYMRSGKLRLAERIVNELLSSQPDDTQLWLLAADIYRQQHDQAQAYFAYAMALKIESMDKAATKKFKQALKHAEKRPLVRAKIQDALATTAGS